MFPINLKDFTNLASSALVNNIMALALLTSRFVMMLLNFPSSALEGTFSWTATQMFRLAACRRRVIRRSV